MSDGCLDAERASTLVAFCISLFVIPVDPGEQLNMNGVVSTDRRIEAWTPLYTKLGSLVTFRVPIPWLCLEQTLEGLAGSTYCRYQL